MSEMPGHAMTMRWLVFHAHGVRVGSVENTPENLAEAKRLMTCQLIQRDVTGTEHYSVLPYASTGGG